MRSTNSIWIILLIMFVLDFYVFQAVRTVSNQASERTKLFINIGYWFISILALVLVFSLPYTQQVNWPKWLKTYIFATLVGVFFAKMITGTFILVDDLRRGSMWALGKLFSNPSVAISTQADGITRSVFISWLGIGMGGGLLGTLLYGYSNKYRYQVKRIKLPVPAGAEALRGLTIVQLSDIHSGSFTDREAVLNGIKKVNNLQPDLILFTGDLVNDRASEMADWVSVFSELKAPLGIYSVLGNHDYGDYVAWPSAEEKAANLDDLKQVHAKMGWRLLMNEAVPIHHKGIHFSLLGIENWGAKGRFPKYGKLNEAAAQVKPDSVMQILLSHDPSHWEAQVLPEYKQIHLTLSGHTHGMQFGVEIPGLRWSPVQYMYKQWAGVYEQEGRYLYVNRGFGFIGYPGRVGILPEITQIELV